MPSTFGLPWLSYLEVPQTVFLIMFLFSSVYPLMWHGLLGACTVQFFLQQLLSARAGS